MSRDELVDALARAGRRPSNSAAGWAAEPKWDGFRALVCVDAGRVVLRSRRGIEMAASFPEVVAGAVQLPGATALDGELVVWDAAGRLAFERLQSRLVRRGAGAARAAEEWPAHFVAFDLLQLFGTDMTGWPYRRRRAALESMFAARRLSAPWTLCPSATEADVVREWLTWAPGGMEGVVFKVGRHLPPVGEGLAEIQGPRDERGDRQRGHRPSGCSPHAAAWQVRRRRPPSVRRPHHHPRPGGR
ncbi:ATP-dependent DNA ligase [Streptomyces avermitilis]|uniref:ATP-dependent DNA ligase n=1 Tax=Streptomyces avermitilis TaxID=33903 RepID=UPI0033EBC6DC